MAWRAIILRRTIRMTTHNQNHQWKTLAAGTALLRRRNLAYVNPPRTLTVHGPHAICLHPSPRLRARRQRHTMQCAPYRHAFATPTMRRDHSSGHRMGLSRALPAHSNPGTRMLSAHVNRRSALQRTDAKITVGAQHAKESGQSTVVCSAKENELPRVLRGWALLTPPPSSRRLSCRAPHRPRHPPEPLAPSTRPRARCGRAGSPPPRHSSPSPGRTRPRGADERA